MKIRFADLWSPKGTIDRGTYALVGIAGFAIKHNLDRIVATYGFHRPWSLFNYLQPVHDIRHITDLRGDEAKLMATLVAMALPFIWVGVALTLKRLRSAGLPGALVILFFVPFVNLLFFAYLSLIPAQEPLAPRQTQPASGSWLQRIAPKSALGSAVAAVVVTVPIGLALVILAAQVLQAYGWGVFVALPFTMGFASATIYGIRRPPTVSGYISAALLSVAVLGGALLATAVEGAVCLIMALPLALPLAAFGGGLAYCIQAVRWVRKDAPAVLGMALLFVPGVEWSEHKFNPPPETFVVRSSIEVHAPPEKVWQQVVAFSEIGPPSELLFRAGVAYPIRAEMLGSGVGAERHCVFSTGAFVEPIEVWDAPRRLKFSVTSNPPPMQEWSPYSHIDTPHLHGFLVSEGGQFLLTSLPDGGTRLEGTTWYRHGLWPSNYWRVWSDAVIHRIHMRVLTHIRDEVEKSQGSED
jgi:uncharacterized membrane protein YhaH (DUF805 family)